MKISHASLRNDFVELDKMQVNIQGVERDLWRTERIDSRLYNNKDAQRVKQELGSKYSQTSIIRTSIIWTIRLSGLFSLVPIFSWILISCDLENSKSQKAQ